MDACFNKVNVLAVLCARTAGSKGHTGAGNRVAHTGAAHSKEARAADAQPVPARTLRVCAARAWEGAEEAATAAEEAEAAAESPRTPACGTHVHEVGSEEKLQTGAEASWGFLATANRTASTPPRPRRRAGVAASTVSDNDPNRRKHRSNT